MIGGETLTIEIEILMTEIIMTEITMTEIMIIGGEMTQI